MGGDPSARYLRFGAGEYPQTGRQKKAKYPAALLEPLNIRNEREAFPACEALNAHDMLRVELEWHDHDDVYISGGASAKQALELCRR